MQPTEPISRTVMVTKPAGVAGAMAHWEARRLHHPYRGPEHLLIGLLRQGDNLAARVLVAHGLDLETVRAEAERLIAQGVLPGPQWATSRDLLFMGPDCGTAIVDGLALGFANAVRPGTSLFLREMLPALLELDEPAGDLADVARFIAGVLPVVNTGIAHRQPGVGQIGAGLVRPPVAAFLGAVGGLAEAMDR